MASDGPEKRRPAFRALSDEQEAAVINVASVVANYAQAIAERIAKDALELSPAEQHAHDALLDGLAALVSAPPKNVSGPVITPVAEGDAAQNASASVPEGIDGDTRLLAIAESLRLDVETATLGAVLRRARFAGQFLPRIEGAFVALPDDLAARVTELIDYHHCRAMIGARSTEAAEMGERDTDVETDRFDATAAMLGHLLTRLAAQHVVLETARETLREWMVRQGGEAVYFPDLFDALVTTLDVTAASDSL